MLDFGYAGYFGRQLKTAIIPLLVEDSDTLFYDIDGDRLSLSRNPLRGTVWLGRESVSLLSTIEWRDFYDPEKERAATLTGVRGFRKKTIVKLLRRADAYSEALINFLVRSVPKSSLRDQLAALRRDRVISRAKRESRASILRYTFTQLAIMFWPVVISLVTALVAFAMRIFPLLLLLLFLIGAAGHAVFKWTPLRAKCGPKRRFAFPSAAPRLVSAEV